MLPKLSKMKFSKNGNVLNNKIVLYVILIIAILNILGYLMNKNLEAVAFFVVIGFLTTYFTPNMIIVLAVAIIGTALFANISAAQKLKEGMKGKKNSKTKHSEEDDDDDDDNDESPATTVKSGKNKVDMVETLNEAYSNLQKTVGKKGVKGLQSDTTQLLDQQKELMANIENMQPLIEGATNLLEGLDMSKFEGITSMLSKFTGGKNIE